MDDKDFLLVMWLSIALFFLLIVGLRYKSEQMSCAAKAKVMNYCYEFGRWQGCVLIKPDGEKILLEPVRYRNRFVK